MFSFVYGWSSVYVPIIYRRSWPLYTEDNNCTEVCVYIYTLKNGHHCDFTITMVDVGWMGGQYGLSSVYIPIILPLYSPRLCIWYYHILPLYYHILYPLLYYHYITHLYMGVIQNYGTRKLPLHRAFANLSRPFTSQQNRDTGLWSGFRVQIRHKDLQEDCI